MPPPACRGDHRLRPGPVERGEQTLGERLTFGLFKGGDHPVKDFRPSDDISLDAVVRRATVALPISRVLAGPCGATSLHVEDRHLPVLASLITAHHEIERLLRRHP